jgi:hypothetical protein
MKNLLALLIGIALVLLCSVAHSADLGPASMDVTWLVAQTGTPPGATPLPVISVKVKRLIGPPIYVEVIEPPRVVLPDKPDLVLSTKDRYGHGSHNYRWRTHYHY